MIALVRSSRYDKGWGYLLGKCKYPPWIKEVYLDEVHAVYEHNCVLMDHGSWFSSKIRGKRFAFIHGGVPLSLDDYDTDQNFLLEKAYEWSRTGLFKAVLCDTEWQKYNLEKVRKVKNVFSVGFPVEFESIKKFKCENKVKKMIVCPGRFDPEKMLPLFSFMLYPLLSKGYAIHFTNPMSREETVKYDPQVVLFADMLSRYGFDIHYNLPKDEYYGMLGMAEVVVIRSLSDALNLGMIEAGYLGSKVIVPDILPFSSYVSTSWKFKPFSGEDLCDKIQKDVEGKVYFDEFDSTKVYDRIVKVIRRTGHV